MSRPVVLAPPLPIVKARRPLVAVVIGEPDALVSLLERLLCTASGPERECAQRLLESAIAKREAA